MRPPSTVCLLQLLPVVLLARAVHGAFGMPATPRIHTIQNHGVLCDNKEPGIGVANFTQYLNHSNPAQGTFQQKYFWHSRYWGGPGYPVILMTPGETPLAPYCGFLSLQALATQFAAAVHGAVVLIEHRYWGDSSPYPVLTTETLQHLTLNNSVADLVHFAQTVQLPFDTNGSSNAPHAPWVLTGGSYSGALTAWTAKLAPDTFWAYHASSAPVQAIYDFWTFFSPIQQGMASNCSSDLADITAYIDGVVETGTAAEIAALKEDFGLASISNEIDFSSALSNGVDLWQESSLTSGYTGFFQMCDAIEGYGVDGARGRQNATDAKTKTAFAAWWFKHKFLPGWCYDKFSYDEWKAPASAGCLDSYNLSSPLYTDRAVNNSANVQWYWMLCNEPFAYWQTGSGPQDRPSIATRLMTAAYFQRQCAVYFGPNKTSDTTSTSFTYGSGDGKTVDDVNRRTDGWNFQGKRILWVNGEFDPWRPASVSSPDRPGGPLVATADAPVVLVRGGKHCEDLAVRHDAYLQGLQVKEVNQVVQWVNEFYNSTASQGKERTVPEFAPITQLRGYSQAPELV
ncbi:Peptidase S28 [Niveomyces insectorum RCEF 264]|uniref:Peptidase S28 n=1 Tax=Niveomyces insectorum RCEF 264 TaxID=1081102 RepID=A0A167SMS4_9HYPO|nr:Peptidase S28 [Niveomyces insectorum RCEF 264]